MNNIQKRQHALVVLSGGQDSVTCLGWALARYGAVTAISFQYGQRHGVELACAREICEKYKVGLKVVNLDRALSDLVTSALTDDAADDNSVSGVHPANENLPASFVPGRNALFLTLAHAYAQELGADDLVAGMCQTDFSGYPDCRRNFINALQVALNIGYEQAIAIRTPLMAMTKAQTFLLAKELGFLQDVLETSHTCYNGDHTTAHAWGYGCGTCPACLLRAKGWAEFQELEKQLAAKSEPKPAPGASAKEGL